MSFFVGCSYSALFLSLSDYAVIANVARNHRLLLMLERLGFIATFEMTRALNSYRYFTIGTRILLKKVKHAL